VTDFREQQDRARRQTALLVLALLASIAGIFGFLWVACATMANGWSAMSDKGPSTLAWSGVAGLGALVIGTVSIGGLSRLSALRGGGSSVALSLGARFVDPGTQDPAGRRLRHVVEEIAIASGVVVPQVFVLDDEPGINALAAGYSSRDAAVVVTRGALDRLTRDELQGVVAHEFAHIAHDDIKLSMRLVAVVAGIEALANVGRFLLRLAVSRRTGSSRNSHVAPALLAGVMLWLAGCVGVGIGTLLRAAVSRQREFLADARAVEFTRDPGGLAGALKKIGGESPLPRSADSPAREYAHMFFSSLSRSNWFGLLATHPPLVERVRRLDPGFDGHFEPAEAPADELGPGRRAARGGTGGAVALAASAPGGVVVGDFVAAMHAAEPAAGVDHLADPVLEAAAGSQLGAAALLLALFDPDGSSADSPYLADEVRRIAPHLAAATASAQIDLALLAAPTLRTLSSAQAEVLWQATEEAIARDGAISPLEAALREVLRDAVRAQRTGRGTAVVRHVSIKSLAASAAGLLSLVSYAGSADPGAAYGAGLQRLPATMRVVPAIRPRGELGAARIGAMFEDLASSAPGLKRRVLEACAAAVAHDGRLGDDEWSWLRAMAIASDLPIPQRELASLIAPARP
jgi:Zn-dependent protease with chaperone function